MRKPSTRRCARALALVAALGAGALAAQEPANNQNEAARLRRAQQQVFRAALQAVSPSMVRIQTIGGGQPGAVARLPVGLPGAAPVFRQADGPTTGLICSADGHVITSTFNFLRDPAVITVTLADGRRFVARLIARDRPAGLALLRIDARDLPLPRWLARHELRPGQWALAAGYGHASAAPAVSVGVLSAVDRLEGRAVQTDAKTSPANYGGPLLDVEGRVIGICVPKAGRGEDEVAGVEWYDSGIGFAIHADYIRQRLPRLRAGQDLRQGFLGLRFDPAGAVVGSSDEPQDPGGVRVVAVPPGPAADAGLRPGDVVTRIDGHRVRRMVAVRRALAGPAAGDRVAITYRRDGEETTVSAQLVSIGALRAAAASQPASQPAGRPVPQSDEGAERP